jgi:thiol-disulfide isomerase/thioredoxin
MIGARSAITLFLTSAAAALLTLAGCGQPSSGGTSASGSTNPPGADQLAVKSAALKPADVNLKVVDGPAHQAAIDAHKGKVVLVDYWATWCDPCKEKFPHIVQLHRDHGGQGLAVLSLSLDYPADEASVREFLASQDATFEHMLSKFGNSEDSVTTFKYKGAVPLYKLYDRKGELKYHFTQFPEDYENGQPIEDLDKRVAELLAEAP